MTILFAKSVCLTSLNNFTRNCVLFYRQDIRLMIYYSYTAWRSHGLCTHSLEIPWTTYMQSGDQMDYAHSLEIWWTTYTQTEGKMEYAHSLAIRRPIYRAWRSHGLCTHTQSGDLMDYAHIVWRSDGLCIQTADPMDYAHTVWWSDGLRTHSLEIRWAMYTAWRYDGLCKQSPEIRWTM
jgi:hypothetical protein